MPRLFNAFAFSLVIFGLVMGCDESSSASVPATFNAPDSMADNTNGLTFLALGDSYTIGEAVEEDDRWPVQLADTLNSLDIPFDDPEIIARTGWRTDDLIAGIAREDPEPGYDLVSLLIGVNNQYQGVPIETYRTEFARLLQTAVTLAGGKTANVLVVSIPDYGYTSFGQPNQETISSELAEYNAVNREITEAAGIRYVYITDISENGLNDPSLVATDGLHPSGKQYSLWVKRILESPTFRQVYGLD